MVNEFQPPTVASYFYAIEELNRRFSTVGIGPFFDPQLFPWVQGIEREWQLIRTEVENVLQDRAAIPTFEQISPEQQGLSQGLWKTYFLFHTGAPVPENCAKCPETTRLLKQIDGMDTAFFSILPPRIHLERHRGPFNGWLRYHLGLIVPQQASACRIQVGDETNHWNEGKSLIFDDSYFHEVWNDTDEQRVVLFVDFARPLRAPASMLNAVHRRVAHYIGYSQKAMQNLKTWTKGSGKDAR